MFLFACPILAAVVAEVLRAGPGHPAAHARRGAPPECHHAEQPRCRPAAADALRAGHRVLPGPPGPARVGDLRNLTTLYPFFKVDIKVT